MALHRPEGYGCDCTTDMSGRELGMKFGDDFLCLAYDERLGMAAGEGVPWHWHDELELLYVVSGAVRMRASGGSTVLREGDTVFVNTRSFHMLTGSPTAHIRSVVFDARLVTGSSTSVFARRYLDPIMLSQNVRFLVWRRDADEDATEMLRHLAAAIDAMDDERDGFEFAVRDNLSQCLLRVYRRLEPAGEADDKVGFGERRIQVMCEFVERHYAEPIKVSDIATSAGVSERECLRCFRASLGESPARFLTIRRLAHAAYLLVNQTEMPIADVARSVGIPSASNFAQLFRRDYNCTPHAYRIRGHR